MPIQVASTRAEMAVEYGNRALYASLHTDAPGETGASEMAIAREAITWGPGAVDGEIVSTYATFTLTTATLVTHIGFWDAASGGNFVDWLEVQADLPVGDYNVSFSYTQT